VTALLRQRLAIALALFGWLAQLWLPIAHAEKMAESADGIAWCGSSPAFEAQLAQLPTEIRQLLSNGAAKSKAHADCLQFCAAAAGAAATPRSQPTVLWVAIREALPALPIPAARDALAVTPPVRGPPSRTRV
jgi:hypothetical protein